LFFVIIDDIFICSLLFIKLHYFASFDTFLEVNGIVEY